MSAKSLFKTVSLTIILIFTLVSVAGAGAIIRRDKSDESRKEKPNVSRTEHPSETRSNSSKQEKSYGTTKESGSSPRATMKDRNIDATPSYRQSNDRTWESGKKYDSHSDSNWKDSHKYDRVGERYSNDRNDHDYGRSQRPPSYHNGRYYYDHGWPYHYDYPLTYGYWAFDYDYGNSLPSVYYYYGYFPYVSCGRVIIVKRPHVTYVEVPIVIHEKSSDTGYYLEKSAGYSIDDVLYDVERAWKTDEPSLLLRYVRSNTDIDVLLDSKYSYSLSAEDYRDMTSDAVNTTKTVDFDFESVKSRGDNRVVAYGIHKFYALDGSLKTVYISYEFERHDGNWDLTEVGSSPRRYGY
ncbi:MAG: hypothetical protein ABFD64_05415 [Armatimonadota bacterium]